MSLPDKMHFEVTVPTDEGFLGRECNSPSCRRYFRVHTESLRPEMYCPYCGDRFPNDSLWTPAQLRYAKDKAIQEVMPKLEQEVRDIFRRAFQGKSGWTYKPGPPIRRRPDPPPPAERKVDSELTCPECSSRFQVDGIFGHCPGCRAENLKLYDANLAIIRRQIPNAPNTIRELRHAYSDLVATFESFVRKEAERHGIERGRFQNLEHTRRTFKAELNVDILSDLDATEVRTLVRVFEKRHVHGHNEGIASPRYVQEIPEDRHLLGKPVPLSLEELEAAAHLLRRVLERLLAARSPKGGA